MPSGIGTQLAGIALSNLSGQEFDRAYIKYMMKDHHKDIAEFERQSKSGSDQDLKDFASRTLPTLQEHYSQIQQIAQQEGVQADRGMRGDTTRTTDRRRSNQETERTTNAK